jgi:hypothetical protein
LFLNALDTIDRLRTLVAFLVEVHNTQMPHAAFAGHNPDEMYLGAAPNLVAELAAARAVAREQRLSANRSASWTRCAESTNPNGPLLDSPVSIGPVATANVKQDALEYSWAKRRRRAKVLGWRVPAPPEVVPQAASRASPIRRYAVATRLALTQCGRVT